MQAIKNSFPQRFMKITKKGEIEGLIAYVKKTVEKNAT